MGRKRSGAYLLAGSVLAICFAMLLAILLALTYLQKMELEEELADMGMGLEDARTRLDGTEKALAREQAGLRDASQTIMGLEAQVEGLGSALAREENISKTLREDLERTQEELERTRDVLQSARSDIEGLKEEIGSMEEDIASSIAWFSDNSRLPSLIRTDRMISMIKRGCVEDGRLKLACVSYLMEAEAGISYRSDPGGDRLYSIEEMLERKGGDCEDISLFFKAAMNGLPSEGLVLEAWEPAAGDYEVYIDKKEGVRYLLRGARGLRIGQMEGMNPYVACYFYASDGYTKMGHCLMMFSQIGISGPQDIGNEALADAVFVEPQSGQHMGGIGSGFRACEDGMQGCEDMAYAIAFIITDDDLYQFGDGRWKHYRGYRERIGEISASLEGILFD